MAEKRKRRRPVDRLIASLIAKLPSPGEEWSAERQKAWLRMMEMALNVTYGGSVPVFSEGLVTSAGFDVYEERTGTVKPNTAMVKAATNGGALAPPVPFFVDPNGLVRRGVGLGFPMESAPRIMPSDVSGTMLYDMRGEHSSLADITWADGSRGVTGLHLDISTAV